MYIKTLLHTPKSTQIFSNSGEEIHMNLARDRAMQQLDQLGVDEDTESVLREYS